MKISRSPLLLAALLLGLCPNGGLLARITTLPDTPVAPVPTNSSLRMLEDAYWRWSFGVLTLPTDPNGNAIFQHDIVFMPLPDAPGDGTPGHVNVTVYAGQQFFLPLWILFGFDYKDGTPPDQFQPLSVFRTLNITFKIDGNTRVDTKNVMQFFSQFRFSPAIPVDDPQVASVIWLQGVGVHEPPFPPGMHTMSLDVVNTVPAFGQFFEYHNTWSVNAIKR